MLITSWFIPDKQISTSWIGPDNSVKITAEQIANVPSFTIIGPPGNTARYQETITSASTSWTINHNLGYNPTSVTILSVGGVIVDAEVLHTSINQVVIIFNTPYAGSVRII